MSKESFSDLGVSEPAVAALAQRSIHTPFSIQSLVIPDASRPRLRRSSRLSGAQQG